MCVGSVMSNSLLPHGLQPARFLCPWNFPGKNSGVVGNIIIYVCIYTYIYIYSYMCLNGLLGGSAGKESACNARDSGSIPRSGRSPGEGNSQLPTLVLLPEEFHRERSLVGYSPWGGKVRQD